MEDTLPVETDLATVTATRAVLRRFGVRPQRRLGQNFLVNKGILARIIAAAQIGPADVVVEVGPGIGTLTRALAAGSGRVLAVEIDAGMIPVLAYTLGPYPNVRVVQADIRRVSLDELAQSAGAAAFKVVANLPYYLTSVFLRRLLAGERLFTMGVLMVQKEVAARLLAVPGSKEYGALTVAVQYFAATSVVTQVKAEHFWPRPEVSSTVLRLVKRQTPAVDVGQTDFFFRVVRAAFGRRRKTLLNSLGSGLNYSREEVRAALTEAGIEAERRAEDLSLAAYAALSRAFLRRREG